MRSGCSACAERTSPSAAAAATSGASRPPEHAPSGGPSRTGGVPQTTDAVSRAHPWARSGRRRGTRRGRRRGAGAGALRAGRAARRIVVLDSAPVAEDGADDPTDAEITAAVVSGEPVVARRGGALWVPRLHR